MVVRPLSSNSYSLTHATESIGLILDSEKLTKIGFNVQTIGRGVEL